MVKLKKVKQELSTIKVIEQKHSTNWSMYHGDCIEVMKGIPDNSIHYSIFSPPFSSLFTYSDSNRDMGNSKNDKEFYEHFKYAIMDMYRVLMPGRLLTFHCTDIPAMKERDGFIALKDFPAQLRELFENVGFYYHSKTIIWKDPLLEAVRTKSIGLAHKQLVKDSAMCRAGLPDYLITMRKPGENPERIPHGRGLERYIGEEREPIFPKDNNAAKNKYSHYVWQRYASPVWYDIRQTNTLNVRLAREKEDERHICPLQLDTIRRCLELWSNPGDIVASWFAGIGSEGYVAIEEKRKFIGVELKGSYYKEAIKNLEYIERASSKNRKFDI